ncbi:hypothetical protein, partial [Streptomyces sp. IBSBF 2390]|uniref:hypothetical protein n=1 Tax=Streptomyces sp. IBSBF 2390 TaxID=2903533 RepID=UPI002FDC7235
MADESRILRDPINMLDIKEELSDSMPMENPTLSQEESLLQGDTTDDDSSKKRKPVKARKKKDDEMTRQVKRYKNTIRQAQFIMDKAASEGPDVVFTEARKSYSKRFENSAK